MFFRSPRRSPGRSVPTPTAAATATAGTDTGVPTAADTVTGGATDTTETTSIIFLGGKEALSRQFFLPPESIARKSQEIIVETEQLKKSNDTQN